MRVVHLNCGTLEPRGGRLVAGEGRPWQRARLVCHCLLIETPSAGLVLVDAGLGRRDIEGRGRLHRLRLRALGARLDPEETASAQLARLGYRAGDVRHIVLTHLDYDHAGGLADFPQAEVHVLAAEHAVAMRPRHRSERERYDPKTWSHRPRWVLHHAEGEPWLGFACARQVQGLPPEVLLVPLLGHTRGHCGVAVETGSGWLLHAGDAYYHQAQLAGGPGPAGLAALARLFAWDLARLEENRARLRELARGDRGVEVFCAHDPGELERLARPRG